WRHPAACHHGMGPAFLQWSVVKVGVWPRRQHFECERRRLREVAHGDPHRARLDAAEQTLKAVNVHRLGKTVANGLADKRMILDLAPTCKILPTCDLVGG